MLLISQAKRKVMITMASDTETIVAPCEKWTREIKHKPHNYDPSAHGNEPKHCPGYGIIVPIPEEPGLPAEWDPEDDEKFVAWAHQIVDSELVVSGHSAEMRAGDKSLVKVFFAFAEDVPQAAQEELVLLLGSFMKSELDFGAADEEEPEEIVTPEEAEEPWPLVVTEEDIEQGLVISNDPENDEITALAFPEKWDAGDGEEPIPFKLSPQSAALIEEHELYKLDILDPPAVMHPEIAGLVKSRMQEVADSVPMIPEEESTELLAAVQCPLATDYESVHGKHTWYDTQKLVADNGYDPDVLLHCVGYELPEE